MFEKFIFSKKQIDKYYNSAIKDLKIAMTANMPEITFKFCYDALLKLAITICAHNGLRIKSRQGHHIELINKLSEFLKNTDIKIIGQEMRAKRNWDLYDGGIIISDKETKEFLEWTKNIFNNADEYLSTNKKLF